MSQPAAITEDEIRQYLNESLSLKLDKDALIKPTKDIVTEIYTRFLDDIHPSWKTPDKHIPIENFNIKFAIVYSIRFILSHFETSHTFQFTDLIAPNRKRTTAFLTVLMFFRDQRDEIQSWWEEKNRDHLEDQEEAAKIAKLTEQRKLELEEHAIRRSRYTRNIGELRESVKEKGRLFESSRKKCDHLQNVVKPKVKERIVAAQKVEAAKAAEHQALEDELAQLKNTLELVTGGPKIRERTRDLEKNRYKETKQFEEYEFSLMKQKKEISELDQVTAYLETNALNKVPDLKSGIMEAEEEQKDIRNQLEQESMRKKDLEARANNLQKMVDNLEAERQKLHTKTKIKLNNSQVLLAQEVAARNNLIYGRGELIKKIKELIALNELREKDIKLREYQIEQRFRVMIDKVEQPLRELQKRIEQSKASHAENMAKHTANLDTIRLLIVGTKQNDTTVDLQTAVNRTYIKV